MIKKLHVIFALFAAGSLAAQTSIPNANFEHWDSIIHYDPTGYFTSNEGHGNLPANAPSNVTQTTGYHGTYGVQLSTIVFGKDTGFAYMTNSNGNPTSGKGGIPYNQQATGFRIYYKCNVMPKDSAGMMFVFKKAGSVIGTYYYTFTGTTSSYTLFNKTFSPALAQTPDSVIFAATSSAVIFSGIQKAGSTLTLDSLTFTGVSSQPGMLNGDFESWVSDTMYTPVSWFVSTVGSARTTDKISGKYAIQLTSGLPSGSNNIQAGEAVDGTIIKVSANRDSIIGGTPYSQTSDSLILYYKYIPGYVGDSANVQLQFNKNSKVISYYGFVLPPSATYKRFSGFVSITSAPDSVLISLVSSKNYPVTSGGSVLKVDSIRFYSQILAGIEPLASEGEIKIYPNPTNDLIYVDLKNYNGKVDAIRLYDLSGKALTTRNYSFSPLKNTTEIFDMSGYSAGTYLIGISTPSGIQYKKVNKVN